MSEEKNTPTQKDPAPKSSMGSQIVWLFALGALFLAITHGGEYFNKENKETEAPIETSDAANAHTNADSELADSPVTSARTDQNPASTTSSSTPATNPKLLKSADNNTQLLILNETTGIRCLLNPTATPKATAQFQLVEIKALHRTTPSHPALLPATLGQTLLDRLNIISHENNTGTLHLSGLSLSHLTADGQAQDLTYTLTKENQLSQSTTSPSQENTTTFTPLLYLLSQK